jgi:putative DNA primase/helicase
MIEHEGERRPFERVPAELKAYAHWVNWRVEDTRKIPVNPLTLGNAGVAWVNTWSAFEQAYETALRASLGLGFVLTEDDPYTCVDLDKCVGADGAVSPDTRTILDQLAGWVELSPSGTGLHIWVKNSEPVNRRTTGIEIYSSGRWMTVTGRSNPKLSLVVPDRTDEIAAFIEHYFPETHVAFSPPPHLPDDEAIWQRLFAAQSGSFFESLYRGDTSVCYNDHSRSVIMLANQLALMTDGDPVRIKHLLYQTGLVSEKWEEKRGHHTWIDHQIADAIEYVARTRR